MTHTQERFIEKWIILLRVQDWDIEWKEKKFKKHTQTGQTQLSTRYGTAKITLKKGVRGKEFKRTAVHELLHVKFAHASWQFDEGSAVYEELELGIETLARLLVG